MFQMHLQGIVNRTGNEGAEAVELEEEDDAKEEKPGVNKKCHRYTSDPPTLCQQGKSHWSVEELTASIPEFAKVYRQRPVDVNNGGMNANHAFALWFTTRQLKPKYIIESGVCKGQSTWLLRQAAGPLSHIFSLDPEPPTKLEFRDTGNTTYFLGGKFKDLSEMDWSDLIPESERTQTLVLLDDHMSSVKRVEQLLAKGFVHLWYDDNWKHGDCYSFNTLCSEVPEGATQVLFKDNFGQVHRKISILEHQQNLAYLREHMEVYFEFPPLFDGCHWPRGGSLLEHHQLAELGLPSVPHDRNNYIHFFPPYVKLRA